MGICITKPRLRWRSGYKNVPTAIKNTKILISPIRWTLKTEILSAEAVTTDCCWPSPFNPGKDSLIIVIYSLFLNSANNSAIGDASSSMDYNSPVSPLAAGKSFIRFAELRAGKDFLFVFFDSYYWVAGHKSENAGHKFILSLIHGSYFN